MSLKSGWCIDEVMYRDLGEDAYARHLHGKCNKDHCDCPNHLTKCASADKVADNSNTESEDTNNG